MQRPLAPHLPAEGIVVRATDALEAEVAVHRVVIDEVDGDQRLRQLQRVEGQEFRLVIVVVVIIVVVAVMVVGGGGVWWW
jgi:hypothetical protein